MPQTVLLIHGDGIKAGSVKHALANSSDGFYVVEWVEHCTEAVCRLRREPIAAILVNLFLPDCDGLQTFARIFQVSPDIPILVLSDVEHEVPQKSPYSAERRITC